LKRESQVGKKGEGEPGPRKVFQTVWKSRQVRKERREEGKCELLKKT